MTESVLITGGTGKTGHLLVRRLRERGVGVRIATRRPGETDQIRFDWTDPTTFADALEDVDAVYLVAPTDRIAQLALMRPFLEQAVGKLSGPLVLLSGSALPEGGAMMGEVHAWLRAHAPNWAALRPSWFQQNFVTQHLASIRDEGCIYSAAGDGAVPFIDAGDIAAVAAEALLSPERVSGGMVLTGPRAVTYDEVASLVAEIVGRPVRHCRLTAAQLAERFRSFGLPSDYAALLAAMDETIAAGGESRVTDTVERVTGRAPKPLRRFLTASAGRFLDTP